MRIEYVGESAKGLGDRGFFVTVKRENSSLMESYVHWFCKEWEYKMGYHGVDPIRPNRYYFFIGGIKDRQMFELVKPYFKSNAKSIANLDARS